MEIVIILPNGLFEDNKLINKESTVYIYEHPVFFTAHNYHKLKLILHRATMKNYEDYIKKKYKCKVTYIEYNKSTDSIFNKHKGKRIDFHDPVDHDVIKDLKRSAKKYGVELFGHDTPLFLSTMKDMTDYLDGGGKYNQTSFYIWQRKRMGILVDKNGKPVGGKWTYDTENRLPFPKNFSKDAKFVTNNSKYVKEAVNYINKHFKDHPGSDNFYLSIDHQGAKNHLKKFLKERLDCFGPYQDAVSKDIIFGCHSVISPFLNIGLLTPQYVIDEIMKKYTKSKLGSIEGILRQILGWREIVRLMYIFKHKEMKKLNYFKHNRKLDKKWYTNESNTGMPVIDDLIKKVMEYGYAHHIERLMYLSNFLLLTETDPDTTFNWFMTFIDSYPWVMSGNVYAMGQYSTGPLLMTRPYFSSSNYIDKMSDYKTKKGTYPKIKLGSEEYEWFEVWDSLYYNFINNNQTVFSKNYAVARSVSHWKKKSKEEQDRLVKIAKSYLKQY